MRSDCECVLAYFLDRRSAGRTQSVDSKDQEVRSQHIHFCCLKRKYRTGFFGLFVEAKDYDRKKLAGIIAQKELKAPGESIRAMLPVRFPLYQEHNVRLRAGRVKLMQVSCGVFRCTRHAQVSTKVKSQHQSRSALVFFGVVYQCGFFAVIVCTPVGPKLLLVIGTRAGSRSGGDRTSETLTRKLFNFSLV